MAKKDNLAVLSEKDLTDMYDKTKNEMFQTKMGAPTSGDDPARSAAFIRESRRQLARVLTELRRREIALADEISRDTGPQDTASPAPEKGAKRTKTPKEADIQPENDKEGDENA